MKNVEYKGVLMPPDAARLAKNYGWNPEKDKAEIDAGKWKNREKFINHCFDGCSVDEQDEAREYVDAVWPEKEES